jgi:multicomponent K+:H+ antiporter subunit G
MSAQLSVWVEIPVVILLVLSSLFALIGAIGLVRMKDYFQRMHPPALASTLGAWCVALASIIYFSALKSAPVLHAWLIPILLAITVPVTTLLLAGRRCSASAWRG